MMALTAFNSTVLTMSSREIAVLLNCKHGNIKVSAERLRDAGALTAALQQSEFTHNGNTYFEYHFNKLDSITLVAQNCPQFMAALVKRWDELESKQQAPAIPRTYAEALLEAGRLALEVEKKAEQLAQAAPKVAFVDNFVEASGSKSLRETAKILRMPERAMIETLIRDRVLYRQSGNLLPYSDRQKSGLFSVKTGQAETQHAFTQTRVTPRGLSWLAERYASELMVN